MVRCDSCLRANPPTRVACLYCGGPLPVHTTAETFQQPALRPLEKWELGYNNILLPSSANVDAPTKAIAEFVRLTEEELRRILAVNSAVPIARSSSTDEASLIQHRLEKLQLPNLVVADTELGIEPGIKLRAANFREDFLEAYQSKEAAPIEIPWNDLSLVVLGRITRIRVELTEERKRSENRVLEADQFFGDELAIELFSKRSTVPYRITGGSFDFSGLGQDKRLLAAENMKLLVEIFRRRTPGLHFDQNYDVLRKALDPVWKLDQQIDSTGWRRARPGKFSLGSVTESSNDAQFSRYARLRYFLQNRDSENNE
ncbi:MAG TPA: hypothetical protein VJT50_00090 [Pyrinomonadaceae bacterium]|nr:hypothetical protein [Pyrinomonadaceae bacterium]